jgi:hypothetical protein
VSLHLPQLFCAAGCSSTKAPAPTTTPAPTSAPPGTVAALDGLLLSPAEITTIMGASHLDATIFQTMDDQQSNPLSNPNCTGALSPPSSRCMQAAAGPRCD